MRFLPARGSLACLAAALFLATLAHADENGRIMQENAPPPPPVVTLPAVSAQADYSDPDLPRVWSNEYVLSSLPTPKQQGLLNIAHIYAANNTAASNDQSKNKNGCGDVKGKPIAVSTGTKYATYPIFAMPGEMGLTFVLYYNTSLRNNGQQWSTNINYWLDLSCLTEAGDPPQCVQVAYFRPDGSSLVFRGRPGVGPFTEMGGNGLATLTYDSSRQVYTLHDEDAMTRTFVPADSTDQIGYLRSVMDPSGIGWTITGGNTAYTVTHTDGQSFTLSSQGTTTTLTDPAGNVYSLNMGMDLGGAVYSVTGFSYPGSPSTAIGFKYDPTVGRLSEVDYNGVPYDITTYVTTSTDPHYRWANGNFRADNTEGVYISYATDSAGNLQATVTNSLGHQSTQTYDGTNGSGGASNGQLSLISDTAVSTCSATTHGRSYDANGNLSETIDNNGNVHTYTYAANGQLQTETEAYGTSVARTTDYVWDPNQQLNRPLSVTVEGWKKTTYTYNAQNRLASESVTNLASTGSANQKLTTTYNYALYGNGMVQTMTVTQPSPNGSDTNTYQYDALGNLKSEANGLGQTTTFSNYNGLGEAGHVVGPNGDATDYTYDARGRVVTKTTYPNGSAATWSYTYDGFGQLYTRTGPDGQVTTWNRDPSSMRVTSITHNDKDGTSTESFSYDANGDVLEHKIARGSNVGLDEVFHYDALGRLYQKIGQHGQSLTYAYDGNGNTQSVANAVGHTVAYQYDALNRLTQTTETGGASPAMPTTAPTINGPSGNINGAYTVSWTSVTNATTYLLQEQVNGGGWATIQNSSSLTWSVGSKPNGTYGYRVQGCNATGCSPWSSVITTTVLYPPSTPALSVPGNNNMGNYTVSWSGVATATSYNLQEQVNGGSWTIVQSSGATSWAPTGKANNTYGYQVQACNASGCSGWSAVGSVVVLLPPASAPTLSTPANNSSGAYTVSWTGVATATSYTLQEQVNGGSWATVQTSGNTSWGAAAKSNGTYTYQVQACNGGGCSAWSSVNTTTVLLPPGSPPSVSSPSANSSGSYAVTWSTIAGATSYNLQEQASGSAWSTVQSTGATSWSASGKANGTYSYQAQSCNSGGCSSWSAVSTTTVLHAPGSAPTLAVPTNSTTGSYTVSWTSVATATSYNLQRQVNGNGWSTVQSSSANSWAASGQANGTYGYQVQACNASGCGPWSAAASDTVLLPPGASSLSVPGNSANGTYTVSWTSVSTATSYNLQEQINGGGWSTVQSNAATSWGSSGRGDATYGYQVQACNASGCGPWSGVGSITVLWPPSSAPSLNVPGRNYSGSYTISWGGVSTASNYTLQEQVNGGAWTSVAANVASNSWSTSGRGNGTYGYQVIACNANGCGPWSGVNSAIVVIPTPIAANGHEYDAVHAGTSGTGNEGVGFDIASGNTWEVYKTIVGNPHVVMVSGAVPPGASTVQYTWTDAGVPAGFLDAGGSIARNDASSPVAISSNPATQYTTATFSLANGEHAHQYHVRIDFYDVAGVNVSSSTVLLVGEVVTNN